MNKKTMNPQSPNSPNPSNLNGKFTCCLNCIDGRIQLPVINWIKNNYDIEFVDMLTQPGMDGFIANPDSDLNDLLEKIHISLRVHDCQEIFLVAHEDCAANPVDFETHRKQLFDSTEKIKNHFPSSKIIGIWINLDGRGKIIIEK